MSADKIRFSDHALEEAGLRGISLDIVRAVVTTPGQLLDAEFDRRVYQSKIEMDGKLYLVRVIVAPGDPLTVITVYRTTRIAKYWSDS